MPTAQQIARHLHDLATSGEEAEPLTPMRLHRLLYYCQGWSLAVFGRPMFAGRLEAWKSGPVEPNVHAVFAGSSAVIGADELGESIALPVEDAELLRAVWGRYGRYSAHGLRVLTHDEPPWRPSRARAEDACGGEITHEAMAGYFRSVAEKETPGGLLEMIPPARVYQSMADEARGDVFTHAEVFARARRRAGHAV